MTPLRLGVLGGGHLGKIHAKLLGTLPNVVLAGVVEPQTSLHGQLQPLINAPLYTHASELYGRVDAAVIAAPTHCHAELASQMLWHGIHVLVEKPLASSLQQARQLVQLANRCQLHLQVGHVEAFNPAVVNLPSDLLPPTWVQAIRQGPYTFRSTDISVVMDLMIHDLDLLLHWQQSPVVQIEASGFCALGERPDTVQARLVFANGNQAQLYASRVSPYRERTMQLFASSGAARIHFAENRLSITRPSPAQKLPPSSELSSPEDRFRQLLPTQDVVVADANPIRDELLDFVQAIQTGNGPRVTGERGMAAIALAEQIETAAQLVSWSPIPIARAA